MTKIVKLSHITAGLIAVLVGYTSTVAIVFQAALAAGATPAEMSSWLFALGIGTGLTCIGLSFHYRIPILTAWSTPGAALLVTSLVGTTMSEAMGIFIFSSLLIILVGVTGIFEKFMTRIPSSFASALLAGILFQFGINIFTTMQHQFYLVAILLVIYLLGKHLFPNFRILMLLTIGVLIEYMHGALNFQHFHLSFSIPHFVAPSFNVSKLIGIGIPLFLVTMTSQNLPGVAAIRSSNYTPPLSAVINWTGIINLLLAPFGCFSCNLAAITAAICLNQEADPDPHTRYKAAMCAGVFYLLVGFLGATVITFFSALPKELIFVVAGLALLGTIINSLKSTLDNDKHREPAFIIFLVTASGFTCLGIGSAFWGLIAGIVAALLLESHHGFSKIFLLRLKDMKK